MHPNADNLIATRFDTVIRSIDDLVRRMDEDCGLARAALARDPMAFPPVGAPGSI